MKVAILGSRGIPASYGGFDTLVEELSIGLSKRGNTEVTVYCRKSYYRDRPSMMKGVRLIYLPAPRFKGIESCCHSILSSLHVLLQGVDLVYFVDPANAPFCLFLRLLGKKVIVHTDGLGWKRTKWSRFARRYYKFTEWLCAWSATSLITDNPAMKDYYLKEYNADSVCIPYGAKNDAGTDKTIYGEMGLEAGDYLLVVARLEPENNTDFIIEEYTRTHSAMPLVVVGDAPYNPRYLKKLRQLADSRIRLVGRLNDQTRLNALYEGAYLYIHGHEVGGTNPSLLRAMGAGTAPVVLDVVFNTLVIGECGFVFEKKAGSLKNLLGHLVANPEEVKRIQKKAQMRAETFFNWNKVIEEHERLFIQAVAD